MCGICGVIDFKSERIIDSSIIEEMTKQLRHRGPDDIRTYITDKVALGFSRLSILDIEGGMQPLANESNSIVMVCNGEIFNYKELKNEMCLKGHKFRTNTDIEVIIHLYEEYGTDILSRLNGQFAFAIYDITRKIVFCARDPVGIAPFFYTLCGGSFVFGSEIKAILRHPAVKKEVDLTALDQIMTFPGLISPRTMFKDIFSLENGHYLVINGDNSIKKYEYWDLIYPKTNEIKYENNEGYYTEKLDDLLTKAVNMRLQADVPVGFYLSGGLDSSIIAAKIKILSGIQRRHSFSIDFTEKEISESKYQRLMADYVGSIHHEKVFGIEDIISNIRKVIFYSECPVKETYNTASITLSHMAREQKVKVVLTGEGADELFAGYVGYRFDKLRIMQPRQQIAETQDEDALRYKIWGDKDFFYEKDYIAFSKKKRSLYSAHINDEFEKIDCLNVPVINNERLSGIDILHKRSYVDFKLRLPEHLLADHGDRIAFANSVEARYPFLDKDIIEFAVSIPPSLKLKDFNEKYILKKLASGLIPEQIIKRPKFAFVAPGSPSLIRQNNEYINEILSYERIRKNGYFNPDTVETLKKQYAHDNFKLNLPYDDDMLITVITTGIFLDVFDMPDL